MPHFRVKPRRVSAGPVQRHFGPLSTAHCPLPTAHCPLPIASPPTVTLRQTSQTGDEAKRPPTPWPMHSHSVCSCQPCSCARAASDDDQRRYLQVRGPAVEGAQGGKRRLADATDHSCTLSVSQSQSHSHRPPCPTPTVSQSPLSIFEPHPEGPHACAIQAPCETSRRAAHPTAHEESPPPSES